MPSVGTSRQEKRKGRRRGLQLRNLRRPALANRHLDFPEYRQSGGFYYCALTWGLSIISIVSGRSPLQRRPHDSAPAISPFLGRYPTQGYVAVFVLSYSSPLLRPS